jgi:hypothetical protein
MSNERELFAAVTKIDVADAVKHIRTKTSYIDNHHRQNYADLIEAQAKLIAWFVAQRSSDDMKSSNLVRGLRSTYSTHPMIMEAADEIDRLLSIAGNSAP